MDPNPLPPPPLSNVINRSLTFTGELLNYLSEKKKIKKKSISSHHENIKQVFINQRPIGLRHSSKQKLLTVFLLVNKSTRNNIKE